MTSLETVRNISLYCQCAVTGWVREQEQSLSVAALPFVLIRMILQYYHVAEYIGYATPGKFALSDERRTLTVIHCGTLIPYNIAYRMTFHWAHYQGKRAGYLQQGFPAEFFRD